MWTAEHRRAAERRGRRYPSDLTDAEWALIAPMIPPAKRGGRKRSVDVREVLNGDAIAAQAARSNPTSSRPCTPPPIPRA